MRSRSDVLEPSAADSGDAGAVHRNASLLAVPQAVGRIRGWGEARDWSGWDPYDGLNSPLSRMLSLGTRLGRRIVVQGVKASPVNVRPILGVRPMRNHKAIALVASGYSYLAANGDARARSAADRWCEWLVAQHVGGADGLAWSYHFDVQTRFFAYPAGSPNTIATTFVGHGLLDVAERLDQPQWIEPAAEAARFLVSSMLIEDESGPFFRYIPADGKLIHNANLLACALLMRVGRLARRDDLRAMAEPAIGTSLRAQRADGSFPYSDWSGQGWVDNFHTGYVLESLAACVEAPGVREALERGIAFWARELFLPDGTPKYYAERATPYDGHCYAQAVDTWLALEGIGLSGPANAERVAGLLVRDMLRPDGAVVFRRGRWVTSRVPFVRWTTAPAFRALARLLWARGMQI